MVILKCQIYYFISLNRTKLPARTMKGNSDMRSTIFFLNIVFLVKYFIASVKLLSN